VIGFAQAMDDDFNTPVAIAALFDLAAEVNRATDSDLKPDIAGLMRQLAGVLGLLGRSPQEFQQSGGQGLDRSRIEGLIAERTAAKASKNYARADAIRADLLAQGVVLEDGPGGTTWRTA
jgi:cysteinyl-tRNA synthetase